MARVEGVDPTKTPFLMRQVFKKVRKAGSRSHAADDRGTSTARLLVLHTSGVASWTEGEDPAQAAVSDYVA